MTNLRTLAIIGYGEVGKTFSRAFLERGDVEVATYDILFDDPETGMQRVAEAKAAGVVPARDAAAACARAEIVISAVTAASAAAVVAQAAGYLKRDQIFFDINSASPATKRQCAQKIEAAGARFVEGAVMAAVSGPGIRVPILAGGPAASAVAEILNKLGMNITPATTEAGRASAMKLCRSIMIKGMEALIIDCATAARQWNVEAEVYGSLRETFPSIDWPELAVAMAERVGKHGIRRAAEMREAARMLSDLGQDPALCAAIADLHERYAREQKAKAASSKSKVA